jgi:integrase
MPPSHVQPKEAEAAGSNPARSTTAEPGPVSLKEGIFKTLWELKKRGYADSTIEGYARKLRTLSKLCDLNCPESVRTVIARKNCRNAFKEALANAYDHYVKVNGLSWNKPLYRRQRNLPYIATTEQINKIISRASRKYALIFSVRRDTGLRPIELHNLTLKSVDLERGTITVRSAKFGNPRVLKLKLSTLAMLKDYVSEHYFGLNEKMFPRPSALRHSFMRYRNEIAGKLHEPSLRKIRLYDLRHHYATMLYHKTKDILHVKEQLGHKRLESTLVYTHLIDFKDEEYIVRVAKTVKEACQLIEAGFEYVTEIDDAKLFRKRK